MIIVNPSEMILKRSSLVISILNLKEKEKVARKKNFFFARFSSSMIYVKSN